MHLLENTLQPELLTLLNSSSTPALSPLFHSRIDRELPEDSFICSLIDSDAQYNSTNAAAGSSNSKASISYTPIATSALLTPSPLSFVPASTSSGSVSQAVIHIQSPSLRSTYIQAGGRATTYERKGKGKAPVPLGVKLDWMGLQVRRLGGRDWAFEVGLVDVKAREGVVRFSTFQHTAKLHLPLKPNAPPILHVPLTLPDPSSETALTPWTQITIHLPSLLPMFQNHALLETPPGSEEEDEGEAEGGYAAGTSKEGGKLKKRKHKVDLTLPPLSRKVQYHHQKLAHAKSLSNSGKPARGGKGSSSQAILEAPAGNGLDYVSYVRIYANCRVKRVWFSKEGGAWMGAGVREEFGLYAAEVS